MGNFLPPGWDSLAARARKPVIAAVAGLRPRRRLRARHANATSSSRPTTRNSVSPRSRSASSPASAARSGSRAPSVRPLAMEMTLTGRMMDAVEAGARRPRRAGRVADGRDHEDHRGQRFSGLRRHCRRRRWRRSPSIVRSRPHSPKVLLFERRDATRCCHLQPEGSVWPHSSRNARRSSSTSEYSSTSSLSPHHFRTQITRTTVHSPPPCRRGRPSGATPALSRNLPYSGGRHERRLPGPDTGPAIAAAPMSIMPASRPSPSIRSASDKPRAARRRATRAHHRCRAI